VILTNLILILCLSVTLSSGNGSKAKAEPMAPELVRLLEKFDRVQDSVHTLSADFTMVTASRLLRKPVTSVGHLYLTKPDAVRWEFSSPEEMSFVIAHGEYLGYFPERKKAERRDFHRWSEQLFRYFGLGQCSEDLSRMYRIRLEPRDDEGLVVLHLEPRKRRARKRVEDVLLWIDPGTFLPVRVLYRGRDGSSRAIEFRNMQMNPDLAAALYEMNLPSDVQVDQGFSGLGGPLQAAPGASSD
jgi:outer membrane lipoprotein-sorting protein